MPFEAFAFDESVGQTEPGRPHVPEGYYLFEGVRIDPTPQDFKGTTGLFAVVKFVEGPEDNATAGVGREMRDYSALAGKKSADGRGSQFGVGQLLGAFGQATLAKKLAERNPDGTPKVAIATYAAFTNLCTNLSKAFAGKQAVGLVADQLGTTGRPFSGIEEWLPASEWPNLKKMRMSPSVGPRVAVSPSGTSALPSPQVASVSSEVDALFADT